MSAALLIRLRAYLDCHELSFTWLMSATAAAQPPACCLCPHTKRKPNYCLIYSPRNKLRLSKGKKPAWGEALATPSPTNPFSQGYKPTRSPTTSHLPSHVVRERCCHHKLPSAPLTSRQLEACHSRAKLPLPRTRLQNGLNLNHLSLGS